MIEPNLLQIVWVALWLLIFGVCGFALWKGGAPERLGAGLVLFVALLGGLIETGVMESNREIGHLGADGLLALGFLFVAVRYASLWLGGAMLFQAVQFSLHAFYFVMKRPYDPFYSVVNNIDLFGVLACLLVGALAAQRRRTVAISKALAAETGADRRNA